MGLSGVVGGLRWEVCGLKRWDWALRWPPWEDMGLLGEPGSGSRDPDRVQVDRSLSEDLDVP